jgi:hypothetical protein
MPFQANTTIGTLGYIAPFMKATGGPPDPAASWCHGADRFALAVLFLAAHLPWLVSAPTDFDEANFVLGLRDFDVATHQPHPPGYPVFIALGKLSLPVARMWPDAPLVFGGPAAVETRALALWATALRHSPSVALRLLPLAGTTAGAARRRSSASAPQYWFTAASAIGCAGPRSIVGDA